MKQIFALPVLVLLLFVSTARAQWGYFSGSLQTSTNFFIRDSMIGAANLPHYDNLKVGTDAWFNLNYANEKFGLETGVRLDLFYNSILRVPTAPRTAVGLGNFYIKKKISDLTISAGYLYDQIGSGILYRAFEERALGIDNALLGARLEYNIKDKVKLKAFSGVQKNYFTILKPVITGFNAEGNFRIKDKVTLVPGIGVLNRSMDKETVEQIVDIVRTYDTCNCFVPKYNTYAFSAYNTLTAGNVSWYIEGAYKTKESIRNTDGNLINTDGNIVYTSLSYSSKGFGITGQFKRTENFYLRNSPLLGETLFQGMIAFLPPTARQNSLRLPALFFAPSRETRELAFGLELTYSPNRKWTFIANGSYIRDFVMAKYNPSDTMFFGEGFVSAQWKVNKKLELELGFQYVRYNRLLYAFEGHHDQDSYTPFFELSYKINRKLSLRAEVQYQHVKKYYGQFIYALLEFNVAPFLSVAVSDMWNFDPNPEVNANAVHYYNIFVAATKGPHRFTLAYVKQVAGIVCTGGVCRYEPAFSGVRFAVTSTF